jgi:hypothetical protein
LKGGLYKKEKMRKLNILVFFVMISVLAGVMSVMAVGPGPVINPIGFQDSKDSGATWTNINGNINNGFALVTDRNSATHYMISFNSS